MREGQKEILTEQTNYIITDMLRDVLRPGGTGYRAATNYEFDKPAAGKTGTTQNWKDAWFTGFTPELAASVWVGFDRNSVSLGRGQAGGVVAAPIWAQFMRDALQDKPSDWFSRPQGVYTITIDRQSGLLPTKDCKNIMTEYFLEGTIPTEYSRECGEKTGGNESFNIDIFNRKDESSRIFESPDSEDNGYSERYNMDFDMGIEDAEPPYMEDLEPEAYEGDAFPTDPYSFPEESDTAVGESFADQSEEAAGDESTGAGDVIGDVIGDSIENAPTTEDNAGSESQQPEDTSNPDTEESIGDLG